MKNRFNMNDNLAPLCATCVSLSFFFGGGGGAFSGGIISACRTRHTASYAGYFKESDSSGFI